MSLHNDAQFADYTYLAAPKTVVMPLARTLVALGSLRLNATRTRRLWVYQKRTTLFSEHTMSTLTVEDVPPAGCRGS